MHIQVDKRTLPLNQQQAFEFLCKVENFERLMPENIEKFEVLDDEIFRFSLSGMPTIVLKKKREVPHSKIVLGAASEKLPFTLTADIDSVGDHSCEVQLQFEGEFNAMMAMMVKGPITKFMDTLAQNMQKIA